MNLFDINHLRVGVTLLSFIAFAAIVFWAWSKRNKASFDEAAQLPFLPEPGASSLNAAKEDFK